MGCLSDVHTKLDSKERQRLWTNRCHQHLVLRHVAFLTGTEKQRKVWPLSVTRHVPDFHRFQGQPVEHLNLVECQNPLHFLQALLWDLQALLVWQTSVTGQTGTQQQLGSFMHLREREKNKKSLFGHFIYWTIRKRFNGYKRQRGKFKATAVS